MERRGTKGTYLNIMKVLYRKLSVNNKLNGEKLKVIILNEEQDETATLSLFFNVVLKILARSIRQQKEIRRIQIEKEEIKFSLSTDDMIEYTSDPKILPGNF